MRYAILGLILVVFISLIVVASQFSGNLSKKLPSLLSPTPIQNDQEVTPISIGTNAVSVYFVIIDDNGKSGPKIGCGDSIVAVQREIYETPDVLKVALDELLSIKDSTYGIENYYNALANSQLKVDRINIQGNNADIYLIGNLSLGGVCDSPRVEEQLKATALQFSTIQNVNFFINDIPLSDALSQR